MRLLTKEQFYWLDFVVAMTDKEIKVRYKKAVLGFFWVVLNPLFQMVAIGAIFGFFIPIRVDNYYIFLLSGLLPWNFFSLSLTKTTPSIVFERNLIQKAFFPREAIVLSIIFSNFYHFIVALMLFSLFLIVSFLVQNSLLAINLELVLAKLGILLIALTWLLALTCAFSLISSALNVRYRDVNFVIQALLPIWFYASPIVYNLSLLPPELQLIIQLNPFTGVIQLFNFALAGQQVPHPEYLILSFVTAICLTLFSWTLFKRESRNFDDWL
jgi:ABC-type polysaccharide/polyol phosphate export permease